MATTSKERLILRSAKDLAHIATITPERLVLRFGEHVEQSTGMAHFFEAELLRRLRALAEVEGEMEDALRLAVERGEAADPPTEGE